MHSLRSSAREVCHSPNLAWYTLSLFVFFLGGNLHLLMWFGFRQHEWPAKWCFSWLLWVFFWTPLMMLYQNTAYWELQCMLSVQATIFSSESVTDTKQNAWFLFQFATLRHPIYYLCVFHGDLLFPEIFFREHMTVFGWKSTSAPSEKEKSSQPPAFPGVWLRPPFRTKPNNVCASMGHGKLKSVMNRCEILNTRMVKPWIHTSSFITFYFGTIWISFVGDIMSKNIQRCMLFFF